MSDKTKQLYYVLYGIVGAVVIVCGFFFYLYLINAGRASVPDALTGQFIIFVTMIVSWIGAEFRGRSIKKRIDDRGSETEKFLTNGAMHRTSEETAQKVVERLAPKRRATDSPMPRTGMRTRKTDRDHP